MNLTRMSASVLSGALFLTPIASAPAVYAQSRFVDVAPGSWEEPAVTALAASGVVTGKTADRFYPDDNLTRAEFATFLVRNLKLPVSAGTNQVFQDVKPGSWEYSYVQTAYQAGLVQGDGSGQFAPDSSITRQDLAKMVANALKIQQVPDPIRQTLSSFTDQGQMASYAKDSIAAAAYLGIIKGYQDHTFAPQNYATRAEAAQMIFNMQSVSSSKLQPLTTPVSQAAVSVTPDTASVAVGASQTFTANILDVNGKPASYPVKWSVSSSIGSVNDNGVFQAGQTGSGTVSAAVYYPDGSTKTASANVTVFEPSYLSYAISSLGKFTPTQQVNLTLNVKNKAGQPWQGAPELPINVTVNGPAGKQVLNAKAVGGVANFSVSETQAGTYTVIASADGAVSAAAATFEVVPGPAVGLEVHASPTPFIEPTQQIQLHANLLDAWGNKTSAPVQFKLSDTSKGSLSSTGDSAAATFTADHQQGSVTVTASTGSLTASTPIRVITSAADLVSGKGDWMMYSDWKKYPVKDTISRLKAAGVTHVYLEVYTTSDGFYGSDALDDFLPQAHQAGIVVMGWIYANLKQPWNDASNVGKVIQYTTPSGDKLDGIAADLEENLSAANVEQFSEAIRSSFGDYYPLVGVVYPASWTWISQPWSTYAKYYNVMAPMLYWHYKAKTYTYNDAYNAVVAEMNAMRKNTSSDMPITIVGQSYNMFDDWQYPQAEEIKGAMQAAKDTGAAGYSTYRGRTATSYEWDQFSQFSW